LIFPWFIMGGLMHIFFWLEFFYQHYPDEDNWRIPRPPPLDYPDTEDTDDTDTYNDYHSKDGRMLYDTGLIVDLWYDIKDGRKIIKPFGGANQPMENI